MSRELKGGARELKQNIQINAVRMLCCVMKSHVESGPDGGGGGRDLFAPKN